MATKNKSTKNTNTSVLTVTDVEIDTVVAAAALDVSSKGSDEKRGAVMSETLKLIKAKLNIPTKAQLPDEVFTRVRTQLQARSSRIAADLFSKADVLTTKRGYTYSKNHHADRKEMMDSVTAKGETILTLPEQIARAKTWAADVKRKVSDLHTGNPNKPNCRSFASATTVEERDEIALNIRKMVNSKSLQAAMEQYSVEAPTIPAEVKKHLKDYEARLSSLRDENGNVVIKTSKVSRTAAASIIKGILGRQK